MIPITFNADDLNNEKKGNIRPQDFASYLSISMTKRAGVLDIFENPCTAYQTNYFTGYATLTMHKGYINIYGRCIYVEEGEQVQVQLPTDNNTVTGVFGVRINLGETGANEVTWFTKTTALRQDDLLNNETNGIYEFALYNYTATSSNIQLTYIAPKMENIADYLKGANFETKATTDNTDAIATTKYVQNNLVNWLPQFKQITLKAIVKAESENISSNVTFSGYGIKYKDYATGKSYWIGNLIGRFRATRDFNAVARFSLNSVSTTGVTFKSVLNAGVLNTKDSNTEYTGEGTGFYPCISDYGNVGGTSISYHPVKTSDNVRKNYYMTMSITNIIMEVE